MKNNFAIKGQISQWLKPNQKFGLDGYMKYK
jgi:hypothetical protein